VTPGIRVDPHVKVLNADIVERAKARGLDAVVYAPHFTRLPDIQAAADRFSDDELTIIPGREVFTGTWRDRKHLLALDLEAPVPDFITLEAAFEAFDRQDAVVLVPHPGYLTVSLDQTDIVRHRGAIHAVETYNPKHWPHHNRAARAIVRDAGLPAFGSSYAHLPGSVGEVWTAFPDIEPTRAAVVDAFRTKAPRTVGHRTGAGHQLRCAAEFAHLFYENSYAKFQRVVLSGTEPTHPTQPAYRDQFAVADDR
jgi:predicted metal-dependent phosphoesterase TrpH